MASDITVEVAYAAPQRQMILVVSLPSGATVEQAIMRSGILEKFPEIDLAQTKVGVFSKLTKLETPLRDKDRVEIYRPLIADPKEVRRKRAAEGKVMKKGRGETGPDAGPAED